MKPESLAASAGINFGLALIVLSLFSIFRKQPSNALIYYSRRLSKGHRVPFDHSFTFSRFLPSVSWIPRAFRVTEDEILQTSGLDALLIIRLFKFGIKFFGVSSIIGLVVLLPVNYGGQDEPSKVYHTMDSFTISNVCRGSNRLWVHFTCLWVVSFYGLYLLYKEYNEVLIKRIQQIRDFRHRPEQFTVLVRQIPLCVEHNALGCSVGHFFSKYHPASYHSHQMLYDAKEIENLLKQAKYLTEKIEGLRGRSTVKKHGKECLLVDTSGVDALKITLLEEKVQEIYHDIRQSQGEIMLKGKELPVAFATFKSRSGAALVAQSQQHSNPLLWITEMAPEPRDVSWRRLAIPYKYLPIYKIGVIVSASLLTIFFAVPVTAVQGIAKFEKLKKWFPPAMAIELIPGLSSIVTGYLPSAVLKGFIYVVPFAMFGMARVGGSISKSKAEIKACNMVFYFLVGNVFFLSLISGSLLDEIGEYLSHPKNFPSHLASSVSAQADFFMTYILTDGLSGFSLEILQPGMLLWDSIMLHTCGRVVSPLLLPLLVGYLCLGYIVYVNQIENVYETVYETSGLYWPYIHHYIFVGIILMQITMIGLFGLKSKPAASIATILLLLMTIAFNEYCKIRFLPTFGHYSIQDAVEHDELDDKNGELEIKCEYASNAYRPPSLRPVNLMISLSESSLTQPLASL
ncbi:CSC1-like protein At3g54510 isoform X2 [Ricinus communis]|uniref:CSC1-like protein At3g54510 isoform X2 n=1 Tax=Ricinus communis TaxID=3988 RepID=UPI00201AF603|nr:CSC1-like protein At3g54510 isoform X2 [Ricinus communis]